jgi:hypothetical protein
MLCSLSAFWSNENVVARVIEILINEQPKHDSAVYAVGVASPFS